MAITPPHFHIYHLVESRADLPDGLTSSRCYIMFDDLHIPIPADLSFTSSSIGFDTWWNMWKTHVFRKALGPQLQQIDPEYVIPEEEVLILCIHPFKSSTPFSRLILLILSAATRWPRTHDQHWGTISLSSNCSWCTFLQRITTNEESDNVCSARLTSVGLQAKTSLCSSCPPSLDQEKEDDHKTSDQETSTSISESIRVQHQPGTSSPKNSYSFHTYVLWLTVILSPGCSWRNLQCRRPESSWDSCNSWCTDGCKRGTSWYSRGSWR